MPLGAEHAICQPWSSVCCLRHGACGTLPVALHAACHAIVRISSCMLRVCAGALLHAATLQVAGPFGRAWMSPSATEVPTYAPHTLAPAASRRSCVTQPTCDPTDPAGKRTKQTNKLGLVAPTEPTAGFVSLAVPRASAVWHGTRRWRRRLRCEGKRAGRSEQASKQQRAGNGVSERVRCLLHLTRSFWLSTLWSVVSRSADHAPPTAAALASTARESPTEATRSASAQTTARPIESDRSGSDRPPTT